MQWNNTMGEYTGLRRRKPWHDNKQIHRSEGKALAAIRSMRARAEGEERGKVHGMDQLHHYPCWEGGDKHWHIGRANKDGQ